MKKVTYADELRDTLWYTYVRGKTDIKQNKLGSVVKMGDIVRANATLLATRNLPDVGDCVFYGFDNIEFMTIRVESTIRPGVMIYDAGWFLYWANEQWLTFDEVMACTL